MSRQMKDTHQLRESDGFIFRFSQGWKHMVLKKKNSGWLEMWLSKVHWTTCENSLSSCIYLFNVCSSLGDNCLNWYSKCYCICVCGEINSCGIPLCMSGCLISQCILIFNSLRLCFIFFLSICLPLSMTGVFYYLSLSHSHFLISKAILIFMLY